MQRRLWKIIEWREFRRLWLKMSYKMLKNSPCTLILFHKQHSNFHPLEEFVIFRVVAQPLLFLLGKLWGLCLDKNIKRSLFWQICNFKLHTLMAILKYGQDSVWGKMGLNRWIFSYVKLLPPSCLLCMFSALMRPFKWGTVQSSTLRGIRITTCQSQKY